MSTYRKKRVFTDSPEPLPELKTGDGLAFVLHRHDASRLHYDLRLEKNGVLRSWALPKGLPERPNVKRLAVQTEDHPLDYLNFQGDIPKGAYGGGRMWVYARGKFEIFREKKNGFYFRLNSNQLNGEYRMHEMKPGEWLLERVDDPVNDWPKNPPQPMLASQQRKVPSGDELTYELKWDGIRALCCYDEDGIRLISRNGRDISVQFQEITGAAFHAYNAVIDSEIVCFNDEGKPDFQKVLSRLNGKSRRQTGAYLYAFDLLYLDGKPVHREPLWKRREWLKETLKGTAEPIRLSKEEEDGKALFKAVKEAGLEGIMAKKLEGKYHPGERTSDWIKVKVREVTDVFIIGYTKGKNERSKTFGALHIAEWVGDTLVYRGKVGTGFSESLMKEIVKRLGKPQKKVPENLKNAPTSGVDDVWLKPGLMAEVRYASLTRNGTFREPVFVNIKH
ncbi:MAG: non-homologous end-joining DNA ligase [Cyclobacteriaceae bacterium]